MDYLVMFLYIFSRSSLCPVSFSVSMVNTRLKNCSKLIMNAILPAKRDSLAIAKALFFAGSFQLFMWFELKLGYNAIWKPARRGYVRLVISLARNIEGAH